MSAPEPGNGNIQVEITDAHEFHCFRLVLNPKGRPAGFPVSACCGDSVHVSGSNPNPYKCVRCGQWCDLAPEGAGRVEIMLHARSLVDLIHKCSSALCDWQAQTSQYLIDRLRSTGVAQPTAAHSPDGEGASDKKEGDPNA